jgi:hypothetical protein
MDAVFVSEPLLDTKARGTNAAANADHHSASAPSSRDEADNFLPPVHAEPDL